MQGSALSCCCCHSKKMTPTASASGFTRREAVRAPHQPHSTSTSKVQALQYYTTFHRYYPQLHVQLHILYYSMVTSTSNVYCGTTTQYYSCTQLTTSQYYVLLLLPGVFTGCLSLLQRTTILWESQSLTLQALPTTHGRRWSLRCPPSGQITTR